TGFNVYWHWSWLARILPFIEQGNLYRVGDEWAHNTSIPVRWEDPPPNGTPGFAHWSPWGGYPFGLKEPGQNPLLGVVVDTYVCPSDSTPRQAEQTLYNGVVLLVAFTHYQGVSGTDFTTHDGCLASNHNVRLTDILDGTSNTLLVGE